MTNSAACSIPPQAVHGPGAAGSGTLLQDLIAARLLDEADALIRGGLANAYEARDEWLASPRGKLDLAAITK